MIYFANDIYEYVSLPLLSTMPEGGQMIATDVASSFFAPFKLTMVLSVFLAMPFILYQIFHVFNIMANTLNQSGLRLGQAMVLGIIKRLLYLRLKPCYCYLNYFIELRPNKLPSVSIQTLTQPNSPIDILGLTTLPPALFTRDSSTEQSSTAK